MIISSEHKVPAFSELDFAFSRIKVHKAWEITTGTSSVQVGIIDSGIAVHKDLKKNVAQGRDFVNRSKNTDNDITGHGTHIAGIIGAAGKKSIGICQNVQLVPLKVVGKNKIFEENAVIEAVLYASEKNIPILNYCNSSCQYDYRLENAIKNYPGLFVCSAGNEGINIDKNPRYPACFNLDNIICVASSDKNDNLSVYSNYGLDSVHLTSPGEMIYTTTADVYSDKMYTYIRGTSAATPHVTAAAALIKSILPNADADLIKSIILSGADKIESLSNKVLSGGRLNIHNSVVICKNLSK